MNTCIIPARGGSKRIPHKNVKDFQGRPMISYSITAALSSNCFDRVIVSTDDQSIAEIAQSFGAEVPFLRPSDLADDYVGTLPVVKHALEWLEGDAGAQASYVCCLYATAPFVQAEALSLALSKMQSSNSDYCLAVTSFAFPIQRAVKVTANDKLEMFYPDHFQSRSQDLNEAYHDAGQFCWGTRDAFRAMKPIFSEWTCPFVLPRHRVQDIDTEEDWRAEIVYRLLKESGDL